MKMNIFFMCILLTSHYNFAHNPIEEITSTPCGQKKCPCPKELKRAHKKEQLEKLGINPELAIAIEHVNRENNKELLEHDITKIKSHLILDVALFFAGLLSPAAQIYLASLEELPAITPLEKVSMKNGFTIMLAGLILGGFFGIRDTIDLKHKQTRLNNLRNS